MIENYPSIFPFLAIGLLAPQPTPPTSLVDLVGLVGLELRRSATELRAKAVPHTKPSQNGLSGWMIMVMASASP